MSARYQIQVLVKGKWLSSDTCSAVEAEHIRRVYGNDTTVRLVPVRP